MLSFSQYLTECGGSYPEYPKHPAMEPLPFEKVGTTEIQDSEEPFKNRVRHKGEDWYHTGKREGGKLEYASYHQGKPTGKRMWRKGK